MIYSVCVCVAELVFLVLAAPAWMSQPVLRGSLHSCSKGEAERQVRARARSENTAAWNMQRALRISHPARGAAESFWLYVIVVCVSFPFFLFFFFPFFLLPLTQGLQCCNDLVSTLVEPSVPSVSRRGAAGRDLSE